MSDELLVKRFIDLSKQAARKGIVMFSDFLTLSEQQVLQMHKEKYDTDIQLFGGYDLAERQMVAFIPDALYYDWNYPFSLVKVVPSYPKFAERLEHRDILGALMSMGIVRGKIGDVIAKPDKAGYYFFAEENILIYLKDEFSSIRHTSIHLEEISLDNLENEAEFAPDFEEKEGLVTSNRLDAIIASICHISRSEALRQITGGKIFINGRESLHNTYLCKKGDVISIRGFGKIRFMGEIGVTRKDRIRFLYYQYK